MTFQQQVAIFLSITVASDRGAESFVLLSLNWLVIGLWSLVTFPSRTASRFKLVQVRLDRWVTVFPFGGQRTIWAIG